MTAYLEGRSKRLGAKGAAGGTDGAYIYTAVGRTAAEDAAIHTTNLEATLWDEGGYVVGDGTLVIPTGKGGLFLVAAGFYIVPNGDIVGGLGVLNWVALVGAIVGTPDVSPLALPGTGFAPMHPATSSGAFVLNNRPATLAVLDDGTVLSHVVQVTASYAAGDATVSAYTNFLSLQRLGAAPSSYSG